MRNAQVVIKDNGNYSTGEWMQNPEKGCPKSEVTLIPPPLPSLSPGIGMTKTGYQMNE